jgi:hypothetical protein
MTEDTLKSGEAKREYGQVLHLHARILRQLQEIRDELAAPGTGAIIRSIRRRTGSSPDEGLSDVTKAVEEAIRSLKMSESKVREEIMADHEHAAVEGVSNLPAPLARFLAERQALPGFSFDVIQDENRGWIIRWKEHTAAGTVRGSGQFYERPYAWLDD